MKVLVNVVVDLDPQEYRNEYNEDYSIADICDMVKSDIHDSLIYNFVDKFPAFHSLEVE
jgi:Cys-tRNA synthase (O-phospho-L-seryl-tRNA:Cys-tRNA synthase)